MFRRAKKQTVLITGASSGIGEATALLLHKRGYNVYAGARRTDRLKSLEQNGIHTLGIDVTDEDSMIAAIKKIEQEAGMVDVLINNAGYGSYGSFEETPMSEARNQMEVNVFGLARLSQLVIPKMRESRKGTIINISSIGGKLGEAFGSWYHASKFAVEGLSDSLALELRPYGIKVVVVEPGGIKTEWGDIAAEKMVEISGDGPYKDAVRKKAEFFAKLQQSKMLSTPDVVARGIVKIVRTKNPKMRYPIGGGAEPLMFLRKYATDKFFYKVLDRFMT